MVTIGITILAMSIVITVYFNCTELLMKKLEVSQLSRRYILKMETEGYLMELEKQNLLEELRDLGVQNIDLNGTTTQPVAYGETITLKIRGTILGKSVKDKEGMWNGRFLWRSYPVEEVRVSTAKN